MIFLQQELTVTKIMTKCLLIRIIKSFVLFHEKYEEAKIKRNTKVVEKEKYFVFYCFLNGDVCKATTSNSGSQANTVGIRNGKGRRKPKSD